ncbi:MAG: aminotransferase class I/II-fold pyridoxal phosphate-dependent enzyme [Erysipelotrichaceae bacterium]|jgi:aminotransferase|nr:aminotransferase class I/II-fold pyridoxal phosphate-dependent enzyme [Erysipelotrichaceae bacterium]
MLDYEKLISDRAERMRPSGIRRFFDLVAEMPECISLGVGEPDFQTPWDIRDAAINSLEIGRTKYTANAGLKELRTEICAWLKRKYGLEYTFDQTLVTVGGSEAIDLAIRALVGPGDEVIIPEPCFVCYDPITTLTGGVPVPVATTVENEFRVTAEQIRNAITDRTKVLVLGYPNNPTGAALRHEDLEAIAEVLRGTDIIVLSDEIYSELSYGSRHESIAGFEGMKERTIVVNGFSKTFSMTGWRLGYAVGPKPLIAAMTKIHQSCIMSAPTTSQFAAISALKDCDDDVEYMRRQYDMRRQYCVRKLNEMGLKTFEPKGAFYVFPDISSSGMTSDEFCEALLQKKHVAIIPGNAFGACGEGYARISYAYSIDHLREAMKRIAEFLNEIQGEK